ncbi:MAG TPA: MOSC domain-containing protein [Syntrophomonadaceae bacterium]|nr:MOSC domain-containing protein [Syntrophomonadaceae bacterium]HNX29839.1 MOSC domain-containing protein [Syntrophomonadaceae bacterium]HPR92924.1 MOSC domain-containing protein [Syntrophomonadaceae bacterium]
MSKGTLYSICISPERGQLKKEVEKAETIDNFGIENDGHAGDWGRQITCLRYESVLKVKEEKGLDVGPGSFAENLLIEGLDLVAIGVGGRLKIGNDVILQVSQIGKEDHPSIVTRTLGVTLLPYEGLFCRVIKGGLIEKGDPVEVL